MPPTTTNNVTGLLSRKILPSTIDGEGGPADGERSGIGFVQVREEMSAVLPEIAVRAMNAEQLGQLRADQEQRDAALEADHHAFGNEVHDRAGLDHPRDERNERDEQRRARRQRAEP